MHPRILVLASAGVNFSPDGTLLASICWPDLQLWRVDPVWSC
jgi:hypothetical protein